MTRRSGSIGRVPTLCLHGIGRPDRELEDGEPRFWITELTFHEMLDVEAEHPHVRLTFDDSNASDASVAFPALAERGLQASFFVLGGRLDRAGSLSRGQVRELHDAGMPIGTHGMDHVPWRGLTTEAQRNREFVEAPQLLEEIIGQPVREAACPRGSYDRSVVRRLKRLGYERVYTVDGGASKAGAWLCDRYTVTRHDTTETLAAYIADPDGSARARAVRRLKGLAKRWR